MYKTFIGLFFLPDSDTLTPYVLWLPQLRSYSKFTVNDNLQTEKEASAPSGHMTSQLIISTSAWPATVYKSAHGLQEQNEESCMIWSGTLKSYTYVWAVTHVFMSPCWCVCVCFSEFVWAAESEVRTGPRTDLQLANSRANFTLFDLLHDTNSYNQSPPGPQSSQSVIYFSDFSFSTFMQH